MLPKKCIICIGTNLHPSLNISRSVSALNALFPDIRWGRTVVTRAEGVLSSASVPDYHNRAAVFTTLMSVSDLKSCFKDIEKACGRTSYSKSTGLVPLDIDILQYDGEILRPEDMKSAYVRQALSSLVC